MAPTDYTALAAVAATTAAVLLLLRSVQSLRAEVETLKSNLSKPSVADERSSTAQPGAKRVANSDGRRRVCIGCSGSVAAVKAAHLAMELIEMHGIYVDLVMTKSGRFFQSVEDRGARGCDELARLSSTLDEDGVARLQVWSDEDEWKDYSGLGDRVLHIDLAKRNHVLVVAPLGANTLASFALGACPNLLTSLARAWYYDMEASFDTPRTSKYGEHVLRKPFIVAPSMNTYMLEQNVTHAHLDSLRARSVEIVEPAVKTLACGDTGKGAMAEVSTIVGKVVAALDGYEASLKTAKAHGRPVFVS